MSDWHFGVLTDLITPELFQCFFCGGSADRTCRDALQTPNDKLGNAEMVYTYLRTSMYVRGTALTLVG